MFKVCMYDFLISYFSFNPVFSLLLLDMIVLDTKASSSVSTLIFIEMNGRT